MTKEEIEERLNKMAGELAELSNEIAKEAKAMGCRVKLEATNILGMVQVSVDAQLPKVMSADAIPDEVKDALGIPRKTEEEMSKEREAEVESLMDAIRKKKEGGN